jgi:hypothetical protein
MACGRRRFALDRGHISARSNVLENDLLQLPELPLTVALCSNAACDSFHDKLIGREV